jgi:hypothetical protein
MSAISPQRLISRTSDPGNKLITSRKSQRAGRKRGWQSVRALTQSHALRQT